jgi:hypothetical protein
MTSFLQAARHTDRDRPLPHQDAAWTYAWECLSQEERSEFLSIFRAAVPTKTDDVPVSWDGVTAAAAQAGARYPELVAAQAALESGWFKTPSGRNNFWGLKGKGTTKPTWEVVNGKEVEVDAHFMNFESVRAGVQYLVRLWYHDYVAPNGKTYQGVNRASDREAAADMLVAQGYATDPAYARKLCELMAKHAPRPKPTQELLKAESKVWRTKVKALNLSQPDASTCQAACIGMAVGDRDIAGIRQRLTKRGTAGDPANMAAIIRSYSNVDYVYEGNASLAQVEGWLKAGELLITHGWFTRSGHVIVLDGLMTKPNGSTSYDVKDPWGEFDGASWKYLPTIKFFDGFYSRQLIYATCVAGSSVANAEYVYRNSSVDLNRAGMWVHRFRV